VDEGEVTAAVERKRPPKAVVGTIIGMLIAMVIANNVGDALTTSWAEHHPAGLIALNSRNRILVLTTNQLDAWSYYSIATLRLLASDPLFYLLGRWYGDGAIRWVEKKSSGYGQSLRWLEKAFAKAAYPLVFLMPNNAICLFAGAAGMSVAVFFALNVLGTFARLYAIRVLGATFDAPIEDVLDFFARYRVQLLILSVGLVLASVVVDRIRGGDEIESLRELADEDETAERE
jgi:membrane protein DedA with SNARE-associated domain